ncbi:MAG TPA: hypothetical protein VFU45_09435 [Gemmatimonadales bacterium]|nr:hypothetical protein [Gemmatimonadales bacterium]
MTRAPGAGAVGLLLAAALHAQAPDPHAVQPERPTVATHAYTVATGWVEIEAGAEFDRYPDKSRGGSAPVVVKVGAGRRAQLDLFGSAAEPPGQGLGIGDVGVALKWRAVERSRWLGDLSLQPSLKLPTGEASAGRGTGTTDLGLVVISSRQVGSVELDLNVGYVHRSGDGSAAPRDATLWTASFGGPLRGAVGWVAECYGYPATSGPAGAASVVAVLAGPTLLVRKWLAFDAGVILPVTGPQPHAVYVGTVYNVGRAWGGE